MHQGDCSLESYLHTQGLPRELFRVDRLLLLPVISIVYLYHVLRCIWSVEVVIVLNLQLPMQSVPITTNVMGSNPAHGEVYSIQH